MLSDQKPTQQPLLQYLMNYSFQATGQGSIYDIVLQSTIDYSNITVSLRITPQLLHQIINNTLQGT